MERHIMSPEYYTDSSAQQLVQFIGELENEISLNLQEAVIYYHHPILKEITNEELLYPDVMLISPYHGVILFKINNEHKNRTYSLELTDNYLSQLENVIFSKLVKSRTKKLKKSKRELIFPLVSYIYAPHLVDDVDTFDIENDIIENKSQIKTIFEDSLEVPLSSEQIKEINAIIESTLGLIKQMDRSYSDEIETKADILRKLEEEIAAFDEIQKYAAFSQLNGPQRIRGLAGSGKTIILCLKAALLHLKYPDKKILYTFMTKSLYDFVENLITKFYKQIGDGRLPDLANGIIIRHAWGGKNLKGVYSDTCRFNNVIPVTFEQAIKYTPRENAFNFICEKLLADTNGKPAKQYDYVLIDEAQDFKPSFYQLCREIVYNDCLVWGYDDLQNIFDVNLQNTMGTFANEYGAQGIDLPQLLQEHPDLDNDIVLSKCYRNPREILVLAHCIGFGIYNDKLIQSLENISHWNDLGYSVLEGDCTNGSQMKIIREQKNSPLTISQLQKPTELITKYSADEFDDEINWVCDEVEKAVTVDCLRADDIAIICLDDRFNKGYFNHISQKLMARNIYTNNLSVNNYEKGYYKENCVTLSTVYKAKGNEASMVFVIGCDVFNASKDTIKMRNKAFTAFTRTKAWLKLSGMNWIEHSLWQEVDKVFSHSFSLEFTHKESRIIRRDLHEMHAKKAKYRALQEEYERKVKALNLSEEDLASLDEDTISKGDI
ncbi:DEAD/DEAH box helicase [Bacillus sp. RS11]|uniref:DEAD/DEAH box helicase n=1 Tax=Lysinibacillus sp. RS11 TaxID=3242682 RepID=UPI0035C73F31